MRPDQLQTPNNTTTPDPIAYQPNSEDQSTPQTVPIVPAPKNTIKLLRHITRTPDWARLTTLRVEDRDVEAGLKLTGAMLRYQQERGVGRAERVMGEVGNNLTS